MIGRGKRVMDLDQVTQLISQAKRARKMADECASPVIAELFKVHARMCERIARQYRPPHLRLVAR